MHPADRLRQWLLELSIDTSQAAALVGCTRAYVSLLQGGRRVPSLEVAVRIEQLTSSWKHGAIAPREWVSPPALVRNAPRNRRRA